MYLTRIILNPRSKQVQAELANPYQMHRTIMHAYPEKLPIGERVLYRLDLDGQSGFPTLLIQSQSLPNWAHLQAGDRDYLLEFNSLADENPAIKPFEPQFTSGQHYIFRLRANPSKKMAVEGKKQGRRVGLYKEEDQVDWLKRKLAACGCKVIDVRTAKQDNQGGALKRDKQTHKLNHAAVRFDGLLIVVQPDLLRNAVSSGIGSAKGFGFGLLSLAPAT